MIGPLPGELPKPPDVAAAGEELPVAVVLLLERVHPLPTRKDLPSTPVPSFFPISPWIVAGDRRKLSDASELFLSLSRLNMTGGTRLSASIRFITNRFLVAPLEKYASPTG